MRHSILTVYIITSNGNSLPPTTHFNIHTHSYQLWQLKETQPLTTVKKSRRKKRKIIKLCSCVTSLACKENMLNFKTEVQNSTCMRDRLNYGCTMQTLPHSLCSFHHPHGTAENKTHSQRWYTTDTVTSKRSLSSLILTPSEQGQERLILQEMHILQNREHLDFSNHHLILKG